jgi:hypothetical protein
MERKIDVDTQSYQCLMADIGLFALKTWRRGKYERVKKVRLSCFKWGRESRKSRKKTR